MPSRSPLLMTMSALGHASGLRPSRSPLGRAAPSDPLQVVQSQSAIVLYASVMPIHDRWPIWLSITEACAPNTRPRHHPHTPRSKRARLRPPGHELPARHRYARCLRASPARLAGPLERRCGCKVSFQVGFGEDSPPQDSFFTRCRAAMPHGNAQKNRLRGLRPRAPDTATSMMIYNLTLRNARPNNYSKEPNSNE